MAVSTLNPIGSLGEPRLTGIGPLSPIAFGAPFQEQMPNPALMAQEITSTLLLLLMSLMAGPPASSLSGGDSFAFSAPAATSASSASPGLGGSAASGAGATTDPSQFQGGTETGRKLASIAQQEATNGDSQGGWCLRDVSRALSKVGINVSGASAYMAADQLANNPKVKEIKASSSELSKLPPGAIVVWDKGPGHPHGHISIALGNGKEASDLVRNQITNYGTSFRVFVPV